MFQLLSRSNKTSYQWWWSYALLLFQTLNTIYPVVRDQTVFLSEQFKELDAMLENKQGMVGKYKQLNQTHKKTLAENAELAAELARLKAAGGNSQND